MPYTGTIPSSVLAVGSGLPAAWTQQTGLSLSALESAWTAYTPTMSVFTLGNGTVLGQYMQVGKFVTFAIAMTFGSTSTAAAGVPTFTLPVAALTGWNNAAMEGRALFTIGSTWEGALFSAGTTTVGCYLRGTLGVLSNHSTTSPGTWTTGSTIQLTGTYQAA